MRSFSEELQVAMNNREQGKFIRTWNAKKLSAKDIELRICRTQGHLYRLTQTKVGGKANVYMCIRCTHYVTREE